MKLLYKACIYLPGKNPLKNIKNIAMVYTSIFILFKVLNNSGHVNSLMMVMMMAAAIP